MKTYVIGLTTFREIVRRPAFWLVILVTAVIIALFNFIPYYTLGEDIKMVKDQGLALIKIIGILIGLFSASVSIADEIDGKTAMTLLSKPITRRSFIIGKFAGIMTAIAMMFVLLGIVFFAVLCFKEYYDAREYALEMPPPWTWDMFWHLEAMLVKMVPGLVLSYFEVTVMCAISVALSTRFPLHLNITACVFVYLLGHLSPQIVESGAGQIEAVKFMATMFATILPGLERFNVGPAISTDAVVPWVGYVLPCFLHCVLYSSIALFLALLLFEDRDLA